MVTVNPDLCPIREAKKISLFFALALPSPRSREPGGERMWFIFPAGFHSKVGQSVPEKLTGGTAENPSGLHCRKENQHEEQQMQDARGSPEDRSGGHFTGDTFDGD